LVLKKIFYLIRNKSALDELKEGSFNDKITKFLTNCNKDEPNGANKVFIGSIQPCYDKKLEPIRPETHIGEEKSIDIVLTTSEIKDLIEENRQEWEKIKIDDTISEKFLYNFELGYRIFQQSLDNNEIIDESRLRVQNIQSFDLSVNSFTNSTSNNY